MSPSSPPDPASLPYRPCVGICLLSADDQVFVARRIDTMVEAWQMPQGGIDPGEAPEDAALRDAVTDFAPHFLGALCQRAARYAGGVLVGGRQHLL